MLLFVQFPMLCWFCHSIVLQLCCYFLQWWLNSSFCNLPFLSSDWSENEFQSLVPECLWYGETHHPQWQSHSVDNTIDWHRIWIFDTCYLHPDMWCSVSVRRYVLFDIRIVSLGISLGDGCDAVSHSTLYYQIHLEIRLRSLSRLILLCFQWLIIEGMIKCVDWWLFSVIEFFIWCHVWTRIYTLCTDQIMVT